MCGHAGGHSKSTSVCVSVTCTYGYMNIYSTTLHVCVGMRAVLCVHIHKSVYSGPCVETCLFALCNQVKCPPRGLFVLSGSKKSLINSSQLHLRLQHRVRYQRLGSDTGLRGPGHILRVCVCVCVCVCVRGRERETK